MFQHLIKASLGNDSKGASSSRNSKLKPKEYIDDGWGDAPVLDKIKQKQPEPFVVQQTPILGRDRGGRGREVFLSQEQGVGLEIDVSHELSEKVSQVLSVNQFGDEQHPMIISNFRSNNPIHYYRTAILHIHEAANDLKTNQKALIEYVNSEGRQQQKLKEQLILQFSRQIGKRGGLKDGEKEVLQRQVKMKSSECLKLAKELAQCKVQLESSRSIQRASNKHIEQDRDKPCPKCRTMELQLSRLRNDLTQNEQQLDKLLIDNEHLQENIFDLQQKAAGIDLQVEKRVREKSRHSDLPPISPIRQDKELIEQLQAQIASLQEKCLSLEQQGYSNQKQAKQRQSALLIKEQSLIQKESALLRRQAGIKQAIAKLQYAKNENYQRQHQLLVAEENLSKKISDLRKKESQLSEWEAQLAQKNNRKKDNTLAHQFPSNDPSFQQSIQELNRSGQSMKSFGRIQPLNQQKTPIDRNEHLNYYKVHTHNDEQTFKSKPQQQHDFVRERQNYVTNERIHTKDDSRRFGESAYVPKGREQQVNQIMAKKYNPQLSNYKESRQTSPYRNLQQPKRTPYHQYALPKNSPNHYREVSKNSKSSLSKGKVPTVYAQQAAQSRNIPRSNNNNQLGGLGSKLQRLREEIKKEIDSIK